MAQVYTANADTTLTLEGEARGQAWARTLRDTVERLLGIERPPVDLTRVADQYLVDELTARGWKVERK